MDLNIKASLLRCVQLMSVPSFILAGGLIVTVPFSYANGDTDTSYVEVNATIISPACTIDFNPVAITGFEVNSATLRTGNVSETRRVKLTLSSCGFGFVDKKPVVILSGNHPKVDDPDVPSGTDTAVIFKDPDASNTALGYWVVVGKTDTPGVDDLYHDGEEVLSGDADTTGNAANNYIYIGVSCMNSSPCGQQAGSLKATLHFTFKYQ
ncbi:hypothetical protein D3Z09_18295 [Rahnella aquatilis]|nr:hypothetical protein D3Z09_18295 [Rahnella aquatilis]